MGGGGSKQHNDKRILASVEYGASHQGLVLRVKEKLWPTIPESLRGVGAKIQCDVRNGQLSVYVESSRVTPELNGDIESLHGLIQQAQGRATRDVVSPKIEVFPLPEEGAGRNTALKGKIASLESEVAAKQAEMESYRKQLDESKRDQSRLEQEAEGRLKEIKGLKRRFSRSLVIEDASIKDCDRSRMDYLLLRGYLLTEVPKVRSLVREIERAFSEITEKHGISEKEEIYRLLEQGFGDVEDMPDHEEKKSRHDRAKNVLKADRDDELMIVDEQKTGLWIKEYEDLKADHDRSREAASRLRRPTIANQMINYLMQSGEAEGNYFIDVFTPIEYKEDFAGFNYTEAQIMALVQDAWMDVREITRGEGDFERREALAVKEADVPKKGIIKYRFKVPRIKVGKSKIEEVKETFKGGIVRKQRDVPLYKLGVRFTVYEMLEHGENSLPSYKDVRGGPPRTDGV